TAYGYVVLHLFEDPPMSVNRRYLLAIFVCRHLLVVFVLVLAAGAVRSDDGERKPAVRIAADKLLKEVLANPKAAAAKYEGKIIAVSGPMSMPTASAARLHDQPDAKNTLSVDADQKKLADPFVDGELAKGEAAKA